MHSLLRQLLPWLAALLLCPWTGLAKAQSGVPWTGVELRNNQAVTAVWPAVRLLHDPAGDTDWHGALARLNDFRSPEGPEGNLGRQSDAVWLALPVRAGDGDGRWMLDIDYPAIVDAEVHLLAGGALVQQAHLGAGQPFSARPLHVRSHAVELDLVPGRDYLLLMRVQTVSTMVLPITLNKPDALLHRESGRLLMHGLFFGTAAALLAYTLFTGFSLRSPLFIFYGLVIVGCCMFFLDFSGVGQQFLWQERSGIVGLISPLSVLLALAAGGVFVSLALEAATTAPLFHRPLMGVAALAALSLIAGLAGLLSYRVTQSMASALGPLVPALAIPVAWRRVRAGDQVGLYMLLGWGSYVVGAVDIALLLRGQLPANTYTLHAFQASILLEMLAWLRVLSLRTEELRVEAEQHAAAVKDLSAIAQTDALTSLPNRRGLDALLPLAVSRATPGAELALFLIDLDGFKAVNDRLGHAVGDQLLVEVSRRLVATLRRADVVARLGGDEFVVLAEGLPSEAEAQALGRKLLKAFEEPVQVGAMPCRIGLTVGFAMAPADGVDGADLMRLADTAMYVGKRAGRRQVRRCSSDLALST